MTVWSKFMAVLAVVAVAGAVEAAEPAKPAKPAKPADLRGEIVKVDGKTITIKTSAKRGEQKEVSATLDDKTAIVDEDEKALTLADLKVGQKVRVSPETGTPTKVEIRGSKKSDKKKDKDAAATPK